MKKIRKGKKILIIFWVILLIAAIALIINFIGKQQQGPENPQEEVSPVIPLPDTTYNDMEVRNVQMEYLEDQDKTIVKMEMYNTTQKVVENEKINVVWVGPNEQVLGQIETHVKNLQPGEQVNMNVILSGDLTATQRINLIKK